MASSKLDLINASVTGHYLGWWMILVSGVENSLPQTVYRLKHDCHCKICDYGMVIMVNYIPDSNPLKLQGSNEGSNTEDQQQPFEIIRWIWQFFWNREIQVWPGKYDYREQNMTRKLTHINVSPIMNNKENEFNLYRLKRFRIHIFNRLRAVSLLLENL